jgi:hypothetical protein
VVDPKLDQLLALGFGRAAAEESLARYHGSLDRAADFLLRSST